MLALDKRGLVWRSDADWPGYADPLAHNTLVHHLALMAKGGAHGH